MSDDLKTCTDHRTVCKYGAKCYQKNPQHHEKFKHPPLHKDKVRTKLRDSRFKPYQKKEKELGQPEKNKEQENTELTEDSPKPVDRNLSVQDDENIIANESTPSVSKQDEEYESDGDKTSLENCDFSYYSKHTDPQVLKEIYLVEMPPDFFKFFECLKKESKDIEDNFSKVNLQLIGPFEFLLGKMPKLLSKDMYLNHWRFFYDPPEFQSVLKKKGTSQFHIGYFRDEPNEKPVFLAKNDSSKDCIITPIAENIFGAVYWFLQNQKQTSPFLSVACHKLMEKVKSWAKEHNYSVDEYNMKTRQKDIVCRTFHSAGIVVPYNKKTQLGYRPLVEKDGKIKEMFKRLKNAKTQDEKDKVLSDIQPVITYASIAMDECDFGTGLEMGIALFCSGLKDLQKSAQKNLEVAYSLLGRDAFKKIIQVHLERRREGPNMSIY